MQWVETINIRGGASANPSELESIFRDLKGCLVVGEGRDVKLAVYRGRFLNSDWAIHLQWETEKPPSGRTALGMELAELIRPLALVDHSVWVECDLDESQKINA